MFVSTTNNNDMDNRKNTRASNGMRNKRMNESVFAERKQVMKHIYSAQRLLRRNGIEMPRIDIRIVDADRSVTTAIGRARMRDKMVWIPADSLKSHKKWMYQIVLHELCHAIWGIEHDNKCKLMHPYLDRSLTNAQAERLFVKYAKKYA